MRLVTRMGCCATFCGRYCIDGCYWCCKAPNSIVELADLEKDLQTGDLLLYAGNTFVPPKLVQWTPYCHAAVVYRHPTSKRLYIFEAGDGYTFDKVQNPKDGVMLAPLRWIFSTAYGARTAKDAMFLVRKLNHPKLSQEQSDAVDRFVADKVGTLYDSVQTIGSATDSCCVLFGCGSPLKDDKSKLFCSESVAALLQEMGVLDKDCPASSFSPGDMAEVTCCGTCCCQMNSLPLINGCTYSKEFLINHPLYDSEEPNWDKYYPEDDASINNEFKRTREDIAELKAKFGMELSPEMKTAMEPYSA